MTFLYFKLAFAGILGGVAMIATGLGLHWHGAMAITAGLAALIMGIRSVDARDDEDEEVINYARPADGPYIAADFPCPDSMPGRKQHSLGYSGYLDPAAMNGEIAFAVVAPDSTSTEDQLRAIGRRLQEWQMKIDSVSRIIGLEQLLDGKFPETPADLFWLSIPPYFEPVALIYVDPKADNERTGRQLIKLLEGLSIAMVVSPAYYSQINR